MAGFVEKLSELTTLIRLRVSDELQDEKQLCTVRDHAQSDT